MAVYTECDQTGGGGKPAGSSGSPASHFSGPLANALSHAGKDRSVLEGLLRGYGQRRTLAASQAGSANTPSAVGSAFDLSSGPAALLAALAGTAFLLLAGTGVRFWRNRHRA